MMTITNAPVRKYNLAKPVRLGMFFSFTKMKGYSMKKITLTAVLFALCFATGFTCSKNAPQQSAQPVETTPTTTTTTSSTTTQENMAAPVTSTTTTDSATGTTGTAAATTGTTSTTTTTTAPAVQPTAPEAHK